MAENTNIKQEHEPDHQTNEDNDNAPNPSMMPPNAQEEPQSAPTGTEDGNHPEPKREEIEASTSSAQGSNMEMLKPLEKWLSNLTVKIQEKDGPKKEIKLNINIPINSDKKLERVLNDCRPYISKKDCNQIDLLLAKTYKEESSEKSLCFTSSQNGETYYTSQPTDKYSENVVYLITCKLCKSCKKQYVGQTTYSLSHRINEHIKNKTGSIYKHLHEEHKKNPNENDLKREVIQEINPEDYDNSKMVLQNIESVWIWRLKTKGKRRDPNKKENESTKNTKSTSTKSDSSADQLSGLNTYQGTVRFVIGENMEMVLELLQ